MGRRELWGGEEKVKYRIECDRVCGEKMYVSYKGLEHPHGLMEINKH